MQSNVKKDTHKFYTTITIDGFIVTSPKKNSNPEELPCIFVPHRPLCRKADLRHQMANCFQHVEETKLCEYNNFKSILNSNRTWQRRDSVHFLNAWSWLNQIYSLAKTPSSRCRVSGPLPTSFWEEFGALVVVSAISDWLTDGLQLYVKQKPGTKLRRKTFQIENCTVLAPRFYRLRST